MSSADEHAACQALFGYPARRLIPALGLAVFCVLLPGTRPAEVGRPKEAHPNFRPSRPAPPRVGELRHPHLCFDENDLTALRGRMGAGRPRALWKRLVSNAALYRDHRSPYYIDPQGRLGDFGRTRVGYFKTLRSASELAFVGLLGNEPEAGRRAAEILAALARPEMVKQTFLSLDGKGADSDEVLCQPSLLQSWALAYDLAAPFLRPDEKKRLVDFLRYRIEFSWSRRWTAPAAKENRSMLWNLGPALLAISLWGDLEHPLLSQYPAFAAPNVEDYVDSAFYADGGSVEGMSYGTVLRYALMFGQALDRKGIRNGIRDRRPMAENAVLFWYLTREPGFLAFPVAKAMGASRLTLDANPMWLDLARQYDVPLARWWWRQRFDATRAESDMAAFDPEDWWPDILFNLLLCDDAETDAGPEALGLSASHHFKKRGMVVARRDHAEETPVFRLVAGPLSFPGAVAQHWDAMSISLSAFGQRLIVDPGYYYAQPKNQPGATLLSMTEGHSSLLLNGKGQEALSRNRIWPAVITWHERQGQFEYMMASAAFAGQGIATDGYGDCPVAERHALVVHGAESPFYVVTCDIFECRRPAAAREPELQFVLVAADDSSLDVTDRGAIIRGSKASLQADLLTREDTTARLDPLRGLPASQTAGDDVRDRNPRLIWGRKGRHARILTVLTPLRHGMPPPEVKLLEDSPQKTACSVVFGGNRDEITFWPPRPEIMQDGVLKTGMRLRVTRRPPGGDPISFHVPGPPGPHIVE